MDVLTFAHVVCRPTEKEAKAYLQHFGQAHADWDAVDNLVRLQFAHAQSFPHDLLALIRDRMAAIGHGDATRRVVVERCARHEPENQAPDFA